MDMKNNQELDLLGPGFLHNKWTIHLRFHLVILPCSILSITLVRLKHMNKMIPENEE